MLVHEQLLLRLLSLLLVEYICYAVAYISRGLILQIICDLVEEKHKGVIAILDEECLRPGGATDKTFLAKLENTIRGSNTHFVTYNNATQKIRKTIGRDVSNLKK